LWVDALPLTRSGKADRSRIGQYAAAVRSASATLADQVAPADDPLAAQWWQAIGIPPDPELADIGFLHLGGHSLTAVRLLAQLLDQFGTELPPSTLLRDNLSLNQLRELIAATESVEQAVAIGGGASVESALAIGGNARRSPLTPAQE